MTKNYFYTSILLVFLFSLSLSAQEAKQQPRPQENTSIEGLNLYPNPVSNGKVYITSKNDSDKEVQIFDVLGKRVLQSTISNKELYIGSISAGVYIIKIKGKAKIPDYVQLRDDNFTLIAYFRTIIFKTSTEVSSDVFSFHNLQWSQFIFYIFSSIFVHQLLVQSIEFFKFDRFFEVILNILVTSVISIIFVLLYSLAFKIKEKV